MSRDFPQEKWHVLWRNLAALSAVMSRWSDHSKLGTHIGAETWLPHPRLCCFHNVFLSALGSSSRFIWNVIINSDREYSGLTVQLSEALHFLAWCIKSTSVWPPWQAMQKQVSRRSSSLCVCSEDQRSFTPVDLSLPTLPGELKLLHAHRPVMTDVWGFLSSHCRYGDPL